MTLNDALDLSAARRPYAAAMAWTGPEGREESMSYGALRDKVLRAAAAFRARGIGRGDRVAIVHRNDPAFVVAWFGLVRLGATAVPVNFMIQNPDELRYMLDHAGAKGVVTQNDLLPGLLAAKRGLPALEQVWTSDPVPAEGAGSFWALVESAAPLEAAPACDPEDTVSILYTSGTTGHPKGVMMTHRNLLTNCAATVERLRFTGEDVWMAVLPMFHTFCWTVCTLVPVTLGAKIVVAASVAPPGPWLERMGAHGATVLAAVPPVWVLLAKSRELRDSILTREIFRRLRVAISGAAPLSRATLDAVREAYGVEILEGYGLTETSPVATMNPPGAGRPGTVGRAIEGVQIRVAGEDGRALPPGGEGEVEIRGPNVMKGYFRDPAATRAAVSPDGWFKSGDVGALDADGYLEIRDRKKDMIIVKGLKVFSAQVERVLLGHPEVREAAVVGVPGPDGEERIKAFVVLGEGARAGAAELRRFCRDHLDPYKRPREIEVLSELPKNALNKTLKRVLRDREKTRLQVATAL